MAIICVSLLTLLAVEYFFRVPFVSHVRTMISIANKSIHIVFSKKISDHWKEVVLFAYSRELTKHTIIIALMIFGCVPLVVLPALFLDWLFVPDPSIVKSIASSSGLAGMTAVSIVYAVLWKRIGYFRLQFWR